VKVTFIMPAVGKRERDYIDSWKMEPLALATLASFTPESIQVNFFDDRLEDINYEEGGDLIAINVETYTAKRAYDISSEFRKKGRQVVLGGFHPTLMPEEAISYADAVVVGEADEVWSQVLLDARQRKLKGIYRSDKRPLLHNIKPRRDIFRDKKYLPISLVETGRGCSFACNFCSISSFFRHSYIPRPIAEIVAEVASLKRKNIFLVDDNIGADFSRAKELFKALKPLKISWFSQGSINMADDVELLQLMKESGCLGLLIGFESLHKQNLLQMNKGWNKGRDNYREALKRFRDYGLVVYATFIFGYDGDTMNSFNEALEFALEQRFFLAAFNHLVPFPGTPLYDKLKNENRLLYDAWWLESNYHFGDVAFYPNQMKPEELSNACMKAREKFYSLASVITRFFDFKSNCGNIYNAFQFLSLNLFSKQEIKKRQGLPLGERLNNE
jgi:radical SAM superfamily enzyme YgiQ (UPF0313 family)